MLVAIGIGVFTFKPRSKNLTCKVKTQKLRRSNRSNKPRTMWGVHGLSNFRFLHFIFPMDSCWIYSNLGYKMFLGKTMSFPPQEQIDLKHVIMYLEAHKSVSKIEIPFMKEDQNGEISFHRLVMLNPFFDEEASIRESRFEVRAKEIAEEFKRKVGKDG